MAGVSQLPVEVLHQIFELLKRQPLPYQTYIPQYRLVSLTRVCKHWQPIAERLLYQSVAIGSDLRHDAAYATEDDNPYVSGSREYAFWFYENFKKARAHDGPIRRASLIIGLFLETLQKHRRLAAIVTELQLFLSDECNPDEIAHKFAKILAACPDVKHVKIINGSNDFAKESLTESLMLKESLVSFKVDNHNRKEGVSLWSASTLLRVMRKWRQIEDVEISSYAFSSDAPYDDEDDDEAELDCCPKLQSITLHQKCHEEDMLRSLDLRNLLRMCSSGINYFRAALAMDDGTLEAFGDCIRAWAPTLERIILNNSVVNETSSSPPLSECVTNLLKLKVLALETLIMDPYALSNLPNLTNLFVSSLSGRGGEDLLFALNDPNKFSALQTIYINFAGSVPFDPEEIMLHSKFSDSFKRRGILYICASEGGCLRLSVWLSVLNCDK